MAARANWKGYLKIAELSCPVALYTAASASERIAFHTLNRATGHRVHRQFVDEETGAPVDAADQVKGYETGKGEYIAVSPEEVAAAVPDSDKTLTVQAFVACAEIDDLYFDRPYYLAPDEAAASEAYDLIHEAMRRRQVVALARTVLFRRVRTLLIRAHDRGMIATTLNFDYEVRSAQEAFDAIPEIKIEDEMRDLAKHIIATKRGSFDPTQVEDRYEAALADLVKAMLDGRPLRARSAPKATKASDLMAALRQSAAGGGRSGEGLPQAEPPSKHTMHSKAAQARCKAG